MGFFVTKVRNIPCGSLDIPQTISSMRGLHYWSVRPVMCQIRGVKTAAAERVVAQCGCHYLTDGAVCLCVLKLGPRAQCRHTHTQRKKPQSLYWFQLIKAGGCCSPVSVCADVCEVNAFLTFQRFPKRHNIGTTPRTTQSSQMFSLLGSSRTSDCALQFSTALFILFPFFFFLFHPHDDQAVTSVWIKVAAQRIHIHVWSKPVLSNWYYKDVWPHPSS